MTQSAQDIRNRLLVARLPAMPQILLKLMELCQADESGMAELAKLIANDAGMTAKVLNVANSAAYHRGGSKVGLLQSLTTLGSDMIKTLVISEAVFQTFNGFPHSSANDLRNFWRHALTTAVLAREIAKRMDYPQVEEAYLAGLLHDVGRLALLAAAPTEYGHNFLAQDNDFLCTVEQQTLQISHAEAGAWLVERWNFDSFMADAILYHHEAAARVGNAHALIRLVHLAHQLAGQDAEVPLAEGAGALCKISDEDLLAIAHGADSQVKKAAAYLGIDLSGMSDKSPPSAWVPAPPVIDAVQLRLTEEVRNMTLAAEMGQSFSRQKGEAQMLDVVRQNARILFNLEETFVLLVDANGESLVGVSMGEQRQRLAGFSVSLAGGGGMADAALQRRMAFLGRESGPLGLAEEQLLRIFGCECLACIPLVAGGRCLGMLVAGVPAWQVADLKRRERFLQAFGAQAASSLDTASRERGEIDRRVASVTQEHLLNSRRVVHEVNNPLAIIKNYLGVLDDKLQRQETVTGELSILNEEIDRVGNIMNEFVGAKPKVQAISTDVNRVVNDLVRLFRESRFLPPSVQIVARVPVQASEIEGPVDALKQILVNLIKNAVEALPKGGSIEIINSGRVQRDGRHFIALSVKDNGPGVPPDVLAKLFTPVKSSKPGENRGIGLSIVHGLVQKLKGQIACSSTASGTVFEILLPARVAAVQRAAPEPFRNEA